MNARTEIKTEPVLAPNSKTSNQAKSVPKLDDNSNYEPSKNGNTVDDEIWNCPNASNRSRVPNGSLNGVEKSFSQGDFSFDESNFRKERTSMTLREGKKLDSSRITFGGSNSVDGDSGDSGDSGFEGSKDHVGSRTDGTKEKLGCVKDTEDPRDKAEQAERNGADSSGGNRSGRFEYGSKRDEIYEVKKDSSGTRRIEEDDLISWSEEEEDSVTRKRKDANEKKDEIREERRIEGSRGIERDRQASGKKEKNARRAEEKDPIGKDKDPSVIHKEKDPSVIHKEKDPSVIHKEKDPSVIRKEKDPSVIHKDPRDKKDPLDSQEDKKHLIDAIQRIFDQDELPPGFDTWNEESQYRWIIERGSKELLNVPDSLGNVIASLMRPGDCGRSPLEKPDWLDPELFRLGQRFADDHAFGLYFANMLSLLILFAPTDTIRPMIISGKSGTPYTAFKRYLSTVHRVRNWYREDPWTKGTAAYKDMQAVRKMHLSIRERLCGMSIEEFETASIIQDPWCPALGHLRQDFQDACPASNDEIRLKKWSNSPHRPFRSLNQCDMAATQFAFMGLPILYPEHFGIHNATEKDFEGFCHLWRSIGYLLGMEDEYNFCRGSLEEVRQRTRDMIDSCLKPGLRDITAEWEHMTRCLVEGIHYYFPAATYASSVLYLSQLINVPVPRFRASLSFLTVLYMQYQKLVLCYFMKWRTIKRLLNKLVHHAIDVAMKFDATVHTKLEAKSAQMLQG